MAGGTVHTLKTTAAATDKMDWKNQIAKVGNALSSWFTFLPLCSPSVPSLFFRPFFYFLPTTSYGHADEQTSINIKTKTWNIKPDREHHHKQEKNEKNDGGKKKNW